MYQRNKIRWFAMHSLCTSANLLGETQWLSLLNLKGHRYWHLTTLWPLS